MRHKLIKGGNTIKDKYKLLEKRLDNLKEDREYHEQHAGTHEDAICQIDEEIGKILSLMGHDK